MWSWDLLVAGTYKLLNMSGPVPWSYTRRRHRVEHGEITPFYNPAISSRQEVSANVNGIAHTSSGCVATSNKSDGIAFCEFRGAWMYSLGICGVCRSEMTDPHVLLCHDLESNDGLENINSFVERCAESLRSTSVFEFGITLPPRSHAFHESCALDAVASDRRCPACRVDWHSRAPIIMSEAGAVRWHIPEIRRLEVDDNEQPDNYINDATTSYNRQVRARTVHSDTIPFDAFDRERNSRFHQQQAQRQALNNMFMAQRQGLQDIIRAVRGSPSLPE